MFFKNDRFFKGLRLMLALDPRRIAIGEVVIDVIQENFIPDLKERIGREADDEKREELELQLEEWERYGNRRTPEGFSWNEEGAKIIKSVANKFRLSDSQAEELALDVTSRFYTREKFSNFLLKYNYDKGPDGLMKLFKKGIGQEAITQMRKKVKELKQLSLDSHAPHDDREMYDQKGTLDVAFDRYLIKDTKKHMAQWVSRELKAKPAKLLFKQWLEKAEREGPDNVSQRDLYETWGKDTGLSDSSMDNYWKEVKRKIVEFLEEEEGVNIGRGIKKKLKLSSEEIANKFIRRRLASWVLELYRGRG